LKQDIKIFKRLMALLTKTGLQGRRHAICWDYSKGRTESSKELTDREMLSVIDALEKGFKELDRCDQMRKKIISMAHEMGWNYAVAGMIKPKADMKRIDDWCIKFGMFHKRLNGHNYGELVRLVSQFETFYKSFLERL
jgi:hypothetical protein